MVFCLLCQVLIKAGSAALLFSGTPARKLLVASALRPLGAIPANTARLRKGHQSERWNKSATPMRQPQAARRRVLHTALTSGEPRRALSRRDESTCKLRRLLSTPSDDEVIRAALKGLPLRDRPSWLIEYLVDVNHLPNDPTPQLRKRSTTRAQLASPRPAPFPAILGEPMVSTTLQSDSSEGGEAIAASASPCALLMHTPERRVPSISLASCAVPALCPTACAVPALCGLDLNENAEVQVAGGAVPTGAGVNASPRAQQYRQEAFDLLAQMGLGPEPSRRKELPPPEPPNLHQLPAGFRIVQCSWDDWRLRELNRQFNKEDAPHIVAKVATCAGSLGLGAPALRLLLWCVPVLTPLLGFAGASREAQRSTTSRLPVGRACRGEGSRRRGRRLRPMARRARPYLRLGSAATRECAAAPALFHHADLSRAPHLAPRPATAHVVARDTLTPRIHRRRAKRRHARSAAAQRLRVTECAAGRRDVRALHVLPAWVIQLRTAS